MRVTRAFRSEERGAVLVIVAASLLFLIGMLVLVVDLGHMIAVKREMVRAADAAALAAAQECALGDGSGDAKDAARALATANYAGASLAPLIFVPSEECDTPTTTTPKLVTVKLSTAVDMFFAPIFGISSGTVTAQATASYEAGWPIPITVDVAPFENCKLHPEPDGSCVIEYPKDTLAEPRWGILDFANWNHPEVTSCPLSASYVTGIINSGGWRDPLPLNGDPPGTDPTYDCLDNGMQFSSWDALEGKTFWFPEIDVTQSIMASGSLYDPGCTSGPQCRVVVADVIGFVQLEVLDVVNDGSTVTLTVKIPSDPVPVPGIAIRLVD